MYGQAIGQGMTALMVLSAVIVVAGAGLGFLAGRAVSLAKGDESEKKATTAAATVLGGCAGAAMGLALLNGYVPKLKF